ncbi:unnamed protein product [Spirodela intermedia]|uniref:Uncharacterized protein n=1 Tax=Spirodela intermedia TaxID=51605 RepID=A0ABN7E9K1_SPIIN|nr:unnamed protein product [Spirodela intermedia]
MICDKRIVNPSSHRHHTTILRNAQDFGVSLMYCCLCYMIQGDNKEGGRCHRVAYSYSKLQKLSEI